MTTEEGYIPVTWGILGLALAIQAAREAYIAEGILARGLKKELPDYFARCEQLFDQYAPLLKEDGLLQNKITFRTLMEAKVPEALLNVPQDEVAGRWLFNPWRGWKAVELVPA